MMQRPEGNGGIAGSGLTSALMSFAPAPEDPPVSVRIKTTKLSSPRPVMGTAEGWAASRAADLAKAKEAKSIAASKPAAPATPPPGDAPFMFQQPVLLKQPSTRSNGPQRSPRKNDVAIATSPRAGSRFSKQSKGKSSVTSAQTALPDVPARGDELHDVLHEHKWSSQLGYGYLPSTARQPSAPESEGTDSSTLPVEPEAPSLASSTQTIVKCLADAAAEVATIKSESLYVELILQKCKGLSALESSTSTSIVPAPLPPASGGNDASVRHGCVPPVIDYSVPLSDEASHQELLQQCLRTPLSRVHTAIAAHIARRLLTTSDPTRMSAVQHVLSNLLRGLYINSDELQDKLSVNGTDPADMQTLFTLGLPAASAWLGDHLEARRLGLRLRCVRTHDDTVTQLYVQSNSRRIRSIWRLACRTVIDQVRRRAVIIRSMALPARTRILKMFTDLPPQWQHNILLAQGKAINPLKAFTVLELCRLLSPQERVQLFHGLSAWLRFGDDVMAALPPGDNLTDRLEALQTAIRAQEACADDDYAAIRRKLTSLSTAARSKNTPDAIADSVDESAPFITVPTLSDPPQPVTTLGGSVALRHGAVLLAETRKICGCATLRTSLQGVFEEELLHRIRCIEEARFSELDRRVTASLLKRQSTQRAVSRVVEAGGVKPGGFDVEPLLLEDLTQDDRNAIQDLVSQYRNEFAARMDAKKAQILSGGGQRRASTTVPKSLSVIEDTAIEDLLTHDGVELMPAVGHAHSDAFPENDAIVREVLMLATENRRLREENMELRASSALSDARVKKLKWLANRAAVHVDTSSHSAATEPTLPVNSGNATANQLGMRLLPALCSLLKLPEDMLHNMPLPAVHDMIARHMTELETDVKRAEVLILQAKEEREQADALLRSRAGSSVTDLVEKLRDAEVEIRLLQSRIRALEQGTASHSTTGDGGVVPRSQSVAGSPRSPAMTLEGGPTTLSNYDSKRVFQLHGPMADQYRVERSLRLAIEASKAIASGVPVKSIDSRRVLGRSYRKASTMADVTYHMPDFDALVSDSSDDDLDSVTFIEVDDDKSASQLIAVPPMALSFNSTTESVTASQNEEGRPPIPHRRSLKVSIPHGEKSERPPSSGGVITTGPVSVSSALQAPPAVLPVIAHPKPPSDRRRGSWSVAEGSDTHSSLTLRQTFRTSPAEVIPPPSDRTTVRSIPSPRSEGAVPITPRSDIPLPPPLTKPPSLRSRRGTSFGTPKRRSPSPASPKGTATPGKRKSSGRRLTKQGSTRVSGSWAPGFEFRVVREQASIVSSTPGLSEFETSTLISLLFEAKLFADGLADLHSNERPDLLDVCRSVMLDKYGMTSIANNVLTQLRSAAGKYAPINARCRVFSTVLGDIDTQALLANTVESVGMTGDGTASEVLAESRRMAIDFLLHVLANTLDLAPAVSAGEASELGLAKRLGHGVPGYGRPNVTLSKAKAGSLVLKLLPKSCSAYWLSTFRSAVAACGDSIDIDSFVDAIMALWYEIHHERMETMVRALHLANKTDKHLKLDAFLEIMISLHPECDEEQATQLYYGTLHPGEASLSFETALGLLMRLVRNSKTRVY